MNLEPVSNKNYFNEIYNYIADAHISDRIGALAADALTLGSEGINTLLETITSKFSKEPKEQLQTARYIFSQQYNDACHAIPWMNLQTLEKFKETDYRLDQMPALDRRTWFGKNYPHFRDWHLPIQQLNDPEVAKKYPHLVSYFQKAIESAPIMPHFYDENHKSMMDGIMGLFTGFLMPNAGIDIESFLNKQISLGCGQTLSMSELMPSLGLRYPLILDGDNQYKIFDQQTNEFVPIDASQIGDKYNANNVDFRNFNKEDQLRFNAFNDSEYGCDATMIPVDNLGMKSVALQPHIGSGFLHKDKSYTLYMMALYNLMWLRLGVGKDNQPLTLEKDGETYLAHQELSELVNQSKINPWNDDLMSKEKFLEFQIAKLFDEDPELFAKARKAADFLFHPISLYDKLRAGKVFDENGEVYSSDRIEPFLPGEKQIVAYYISLMVRQLWYIGINPDAFSEVVFGDERIPLVGRVISAFSGEFQATWKEIADRLKQLDRKDFVSFAGHGYVVSFDPKLEELQNAQNVHDKDLLQNLGFAGIESWLGKQLQGHVFYIV